MSSYAWVLILAGIVPFAVSFYPRLNFWRHWRALVHALVLILGIFGAWDVFATFRRHWFFNPEGVWPVRIMNLPIEEVLFFVVIPFCCIFTWEALQYLAGRRR